MQSILVWFEYLDGNNFCSSVLHFNTKSLTGRIMTSFWSSITRNCSINGHISHFKHLMYWSADPIWIQAKHLKWYFYLSLMVIDDCEIFHESKMSKIGYGLYWLDWCKYKFMTECKILFKVQPKNALQNYI